MSCYYYSNWNQFVFVSFIDLKTETYQFYWLCWNIWLSLAFKCIGLTMQMLWYFHGLVIPDEIKSSEALRIKATVVYRKSMFWGVRWWKDVPGCSKVIHDKSEFFFVYRYYFCRMLIWKSALFYKTAQTSRVITQVLNFIYEYILKKIIPSSTDNLKPKVPLTNQNHKLKLIKRKQNNIHVSDLVQVFLYGLNLVLWLAVSKDLHWQDSFIA